MLSIPLLVRQFLRSRYIFRIVFVLFLKPNDITQECKRKILNLIYDKYTGVVRTVGLVEEERPKASRIDIKRQMKQKNISFRKYSWLNTLKFWL